MEKLNTYIKRLIKFVIYGQPIVHTEAKIINLGVNNLLEGRTALITGASSGIGLSIAKYFAQAGANIVMAGRNMEKLQKVSQCVKEQSDKGIDIQCLAFDIKQVQNYKSMIIDTLRMGGVDILVNSAGVDSKSMPQATEEEYDSVLDTNLKGTYFLSQIVAQYMIKNNIKGNILNISSSSSLRPGNSPYILSKWGVRSLTMGLAKSLAPHGITVNSIAPGLTLTPMMKIKDTSNLNISAVPIGRFALPEEIANMAVILCSEMGRLVVGDTVFMTGGLGNLTVDDYPLRYKFE